MDYNLYVWLILIKKIDQFRTEEMRQTDFICVFQMHRTILKKHVLWCPDNETMVTNAGGDDK